MYCGQCGTPNHDEAGHCDTCGAPLLITTGARTCGTCGAALGDHDRFCTTCGTPATDASDSSTAYDAADDFGEIDIDDIQLDELPDWLQSMAPSQSPSAEQTPAQSQARATGQPEPDDLPDWLRDVPDASASTSQPSGSASTPPTPPPNPGPVSHQPADEFSLVSDDDLPDWLKALSDEDDTGGSQTTQQQPAAARPEPSRPMGEPTRAVANLYEVPAVSRAWLTQGRSVDQSQVTSARQEFAPLEALSSVATEQANRTGIWDSDWEQPSAEDEATSPFVVPQKQEEQSSETGRGQLVVRIVILALVVIVVLLLAFVLIQGV